MASVALSALLLLGAAYLASERGDEARAYGITIETLSAGGAALSAVQAAPATVPSMQVHDLRVDGALTRVPALLQGEIGTITFSRSPLAADELEMTFGKERIPVPPGARVTIEDAVGAAEVGSTEPLPSLVLTGTASKVVVENAPGHAFSTSADDPVPGIPVDAVLLDGTPVVDDFRDVGRFDQIVVMPANHGGTIDVLWQHEELELTVGFDSRSVNPLDPGEPASLNATPVLVLDGAYVAVDVGHHEGELWLQIEGLVDAVLFPDILDVELGGETLSLSEQHNVRGDVEAVDAVFHEVGAFLTERGVNTAPVADFDFSPANPTTGTVVSFQDRSTDAEEGTPLWVEWTFCDGFTSAQRNPLWAPEEGGPCPVTLVATDVFGAQDSITRTLSVVGNPPVLDVEYLPDPANIVEPTTFRSHAFDPDGTPVTVTWQFHNGSVDAGRNVSFQYLTKGTYPVTVTAVDGDGQSTTLTVEVVVANVRPDAVVLVSPPAVLTNETVTLTDASSDPDAPSPPGIVNRTWNVETHAPRTGVSEAYTFTRPGSYALELTVEDADGATNSTAAVVEVGNRAPTLSIAANKTTANVTEPVEITASYHDPDAPPGFHGTPPDGFDWTANGETLTGNGAVIEPSFASGGVVHVIAEATDVDGATVRAHLNLTIAAPPVVAFDASPGTSVPSGTTITFTDESFDPDPSGSIVSRTWVWAHDGLTSTSATHSRTIEVPGTYVVTLSVTDDLGVSASTDIPVTILNRAPTVEIGPAPGVVNVGDEVTFTATATDPDNNITGLQWFLNGNPLGTNATQSIVFTSGTNTVLARATDESGGTADDTHTVVVNNAPSVSIAGVPSTIQIGTTVAFNVVYSDPDDDPIASVDWSFGDGGSGGGSPFSYAYSVAGTYTVWVNVTDDRGGTASATKVVTVVPPPFVVGISHTPAGGIETGTTVDFELDIPDGYVLSSATWTFGDDAPVAGGGTISHAFTTSGPIDVSVVATSHDGKTDGAAVTLDVVSSTAITTTMRVLLPDGKELNVTHPDLNFTLSVPRAGVVASTQAGSMTVLGNGELRATVPGGSWAAGDRATLEVLVGPFGFDGTFAFVHSSSMAVDVRLTDFPTVLADLGFGCEPGQTRTVEGHCVFEATGEAVEAVGRVTWVEGTPAEGVRLDVLVQSTTPRRPGTPVLEIPLFGARDEHTVVSDVDGIVRFDVPSPVFHFDEDGVVVELADGTTEPVPIVNEMVEPGTFDGMPYLPGRYTVWLGDSGDYWQASGNAAFFADVSDLFTTLGFA